MAQPDAPIVTWPAKAGDMLIFHPQLIHGSLARTPGQPGRRIGFSSRWIGSDARWMPDDYAARIPVIEENPSVQYGKPAPEDVFPIVYRASAAIS